MDFINTYNSDSESEEVEFIPKKSKTESSVISPLKVQLPINPPTIEKVESLPLKKINDKASIMNELFSTKKKTLPLQKTPIIPQIKGETTKTSLPSTKTLDTMTKPNQTKNIPTSITSSNINDSTSKKSMILNHKKSSNILLPPQFRAPNQSTFELEHSGKITKSTPLKETSEDYLVDLNTLKK